jgi:Tfp pilus assembly protein PilO
MNTDRLWVVAAVVGMVVVALAGWFVGISPIVAQAAAADESAASTTAANQASESRLAVLKTQYAGIGKLQKTLDSLRESIPEGANASVFQQEINGLCAEYGVTLSSVTVNSATIYQAVTPAVAPTTGTSTSTPTPTPTTSTTPAATPAPSTAQTNGLVLVPVVVAVIGSFDDVKAFIGALQSGPRLYLATGVQISDNDGIYTGTLSGDVFTVAGTSTPTKSSIPTPVPTPTPTPTPTSTATPTATPTPTQTPTP